jgi:type IV secretory pathway VirB2 component (pilin)
MTIQTAAMTRQTTTEHELSTHTVALAIVLYFAMAAMVLANNCPQSGETTPMGEVLCTVVDFMYGNLGRGLATLAVITLGVGALLGKTSWGMAITVGIGIAVIFNAEAITALLLGCSNSNFCT